MNDPLRRQQAFFDLIAVVLARFATASAGDLDEHIRASLGELAEFVGVDYAFVIEFTDDRTTWSATHEWGAPGLPSNLPDYQDIPFGTVKWAERVLLAGEAVVINSLDDAPPVAAAERALWESLGIQSTLHLPLRGRGGFVKGCVALNSIRRQVTWAEADVRRLTLVGEAIANAMERARAEKELRESFDAVPDLIFVLDDQYRIVRANRAAAERLSCTREDLLGQRCHEIIHDAVAPPEPCPHAQVLADGKARCFETHEPQLGGDFLVSCTALRDVRARVIGAVHVARDITDLKRSEAALRRVHEELKQRRALVVAASLDGVWEWDLASDAVQYSDRFVELLGYRRDEVSATLDFFRSILHPEDAEPVWAAVSRHLTEGAPYDVEFRLRVKAGSYRWFRSRGEAQRDSTNRAIWMAGSLQDVHDRKVAEAELREALHEVERLTDRLRAENVYLQQEIASTQGFDEIVGESEPLRLTLNKIERVADTDASVLLLGETGTGKELLARAIHQHSPRKDRPLVKVNLAALPSSLIESELFGHVKGAFTGAVSDKVGRFELADGGTLFLDEIGELEPELQTKLLRVLQEGDFERIGSADTVRVDVRVVAGTNRDLRRAMEQERFRPDLYYRLAVFPIEVPPLRQRREDIPLLVWHFISKKQVRLGKTIDSIPEKVMESLVEYDWPGNVRELENVIERAMILSPGTTLNLPESLKPVSRPPRQSATTRRDGVGRAQIIAVLDACGWKIKGTGNAADRLGIKPSTLRYRMKTLGIQRPKAQGTRHA